jgi:uncharacterized membrane protein
VALVAWGAGGSVTLALAGLGIGISGMLLDSLLGATLQGRFHCPACGIATERRRHRCGVPAVSTGGIAWISNDVVNGLATLAATAAGCVAAARWR